MYVSVILRLWIAVFWYSFSLSKECAAPLETLLLHHQSKWKGQFHLTIHYPSKIWGELEHHCWFACVYVHIAGTRPNHFQNYFWWVTIQKKLFSCFYYDVVNSCIGIVSQKEVSWIWTWISGCCWSIDINEWNMIEIEFIGLTRMWISKIFADWVWRANSPKKGLQFIFVCVCSSHRITVNWSFLDVANSAFL